MAKPGELTDEQVNALRRVALFLRWSGPVRPFKGPKYEDRLGIKQQRASVLLRGGRVGVTAAKAIADATKLVDYGRFMAGDPSGALDRKVRDWVPPPEAQAEMDAVDASESLEREDATDHEVRFPLFATLSDIHRYVREHEVAAELLEDVDHFPREVAEDLVYEARIAQFDEKESPTVGKRARQIAQHARELYRGQGIPEGAVHLREMPPGKKSR